MIVGTANWNDLRGFYPRGMERSNKLAYYGARLTGVEVNATFFRMQAPEIVSKWVEQTPQDFMMSLKAQRVISAWVRNPGKADQRVFDRHLAMAQPLIEASKFAGYVIRLPVQMSRPHNIERSIAVLREGFADLPLIVDGPMALDQDLRADVNQALRDSGITKARHDLTCSGEAIGDLTGLAYFRFGGADLVSARSSQRAICSDREILERADVVEATVRSTVMTMVVFYGKQHVDTADAALRLSAELRNRRIVVG